MSVKQPWLAADGTGIERGKLWLVRILMVLLGFNAIGSATSLAYALGSLAGIVILYALAIQVLSSPIESAS